MQETVVVREEYLFWYHWPRGSFPVQFQFHKKETLTSCYLVRVHKPALFVGMMSVSGVVPNSIDRTIPMVPPAVQMHRPTVDQLAPAHISG